MLITVAFTLAGFALLLCQILLVDTCRLIRRVSVEVHEAIGHDTKVFPDHTDLDIDDEARSTRRGL